MAGALEMGSSAITRELPAPAGREAPPQPAFCPLPAVAAGSGAARGPDGPGGWPAAYFLFD